jgi:pimeloyl-ACP methyl ester carboxylesterase
MSLSTRHEAGYLETPGARIYYEVRGGRGPVLLLHAAPMDASAFEPLAGLLQDAFTVVTCDPRGINRSTVDEPDRDVTPDDRAGDLAHLLRHLGLHPAAVFGSSGGAVSALALLQAEPGLVTTVVAHEPPLADLVEDRDRLRVDTDEIIRTYLDGDRRAAWTLFLESADIRLPTEVFDAMFGGPLDAPAAADERFSFEHMERATTFWTPDLQRLRSHHDGLRVAIGAESAGQLCDRTSRALAEALDVDPIVFPGGHVGFLQHPEAFALRLRDELAVTA